MIDRRGEPDVGGADANFLIVGSNSSRSSSPCEHSKHDSYPSQRQNKDYGKLIGIKREIRQQTFSTS